MSESFDEEQMARQCRLYNCTLISIVGVVATVELGRPALMNDGSDNEGVLCSLLESAGFEVTYVPYVYQPGDPESG